MKNSNTSLLSTHNVHHRAIINNQENASKLQMQNEITVTDLSAYYKIICAHTLSEFIHYCHKHNFAYTTFIHSESSEQFTSISKIEQQAIKDLNIFYQTLLNRNLATHETSIKEFAPRWKQCQTIFKKSLKDKAKLYTAMQTITYKLEKSPHSFKDWTEYYAKVCAYQLTDWVHYCYTTTQHKCAAFTCFIVDENSPGFKKLPRSEQKVFKALHKFYKKISFASKEREEHLIKKYAKRWKEYQHIFNNAKEKIH